jgi:general secretion pathway protein A
MNPPDSAAFFDFVQRPFSLTPDPRFYFRSRSHSRVFDALAAAVARREALMIVIGDLGVGKTTLLRTLMDMQARTWRGALIGNALLSPEDLLRLVLQDFGAVAPDEVREGRLAGAGRAELVEMFERFVRRLAAADEGGVLIVDEAHSLPAATMDHLVELASLNANAQKTVQFLLAGQPAIGGGMRARGADDRVGVRARLLPLERDECARYINHRVEIGGGGATFADRATEHIYALSGGVPRLVNLLCERALQEAAAARSRQIEAVMIESAASALDLLRLSPKRFRWYAAKSCRSA